MRLLRDFFERPSLAVAPDLLGKSLVHVTAVGEYRGIITELEVYLSVTDQASHAHRGLTSRNRPMWLSGGHAYVYFIYGRYYCFNVVTELADQPAAILIRSIIPIEDNKFLKQIQGPAKVCQYLNIDRQQNGIDCVTSDELFFEDRGYQVLNYLTTSRVGLKRAVDKPWRFIATELQTADLTRISLQHQTLRI